MNRNFRGQVWRKLAWAAAAFPLLASAQTNINGLPVTNTTHLSVSNAPPAPRRPGIILILADNIGYGDLGCYGQTKIKTPRLDQLAREGIRFTSYYAGSPKDEISRASLFTGLEPRHIGAGFSRPLPVDAVTVAALLQGVGYHTGLIGEWNLGDTPPVQPAAKGFNEFAGFLGPEAARNYYTDTIYRQDTATGSNTVATLSKNWNNAHGMYVPDFLGEVAGNFLRDNRPYRVNHYRGFFLCVSFPIPHDVAAPKDTLYVDETWPQREKDRAAMITHMDDSIGLVLDALTKLKMDTNTVVIFTSVGGPQKEGAMDPKFFDSTGPLRGWGGSVYEGGIRVPMIIRWPARIKPGQVSDIPWVAWDFLATAADMALTKPPTNTDGISLLPALNGKGKTSEHKSLYWESDEGGSQQAARMGDWKMVRLGTNAPALYNLKADPGELNDVADRNPEVLKQINSLFPTGTITKITN